jgi:hypothetical protein
VPPVRYELGFIYQKTAVCIVPAVTREKGLQERFI